MSTNEHKFKLNKDGYLEIDLCSELGYANEQIIRITINGISFKAKYSNRNNLFTKVQTEFIIVRTGKKFKMIGFPHQTVFFTIKT